ncbi:venom allergen 2-like [Polyergus mexicanus]|uniref:venom allergen 2-like n=1 Tax=Polyergus mexicanus TaxID=615972 RepID=UPI0038B54B78
MKTLVLMTCLLTISYAANPQKVKEFYDNFASCVEELNAQQWTLEVVKCKLQKDGLIHEQSRVKKEEVSAYLEDVISDETNLSQAKEILSTCMDQAYQGSSSNDEQLTTYIKCGYPILDLIDKLQ